MKFLAKIMIALAAASVFIACMMDATRAADLTQPLTLVTTNRLTGSIHQELIVR